MPFSHEGALSNFALTKPVAERAAFLDREAAPMLPRAKGSNPC